MNERDQVSINREKILNILLEDGVKSLTEKWVEKNTEAMRDKYSFKSSNPPADELTSKNLEEKTREQKIIAHAKAKGGRRVHSRKRVGF